MEAVRCARVIINNPSRATDKLFSYLCTENVVAGMSVKIPFGKGNTILDGLVFSVAEEEKNDKLKEIYSEGRQT